MPEKCMMCHQKDARRMCEFPGGYIAKLCIDCHNETRRYIINHSTTSYYWESMASFRRALSGLPSTSGMSENSSIADYISIEAEMHDVVRHFIENNGYRDA